ncbi:hypothetical protein TUM19329_11880 [Legionella antarctica]|uniref:TM2 domain-containing protein n=1 Tax=Legionella antarctica TaxID=2708020 RepID=A0A6F8T3T5_9GAMM|nr:DUF4864 domain-containing protein [Legionella antarctica]BCA94827.1 hypothetical protein TUM19329_11880 [Legionella antarctica]
MNTNNFCLRCGNPLDSDALFCSKCGTRTEQATIQSQAVKNSAPLKENQSSKSGKAALILCIFLGMLGAHRFYVGKIWTGILMLLSGGAIGVWALIDVIVIVKNKFEDKNGNRLEVSYKLPPVKELILLISSVMACLAVIIVSITAVLTYATSSLITVVDHQLTALQTGQMEKAYAYNSTEFQKNISIDGFRSYVAQFPALINNASSNFSERKIVNNTGYLAGILTAKDGTTTPVAYQLIQENGKWKILNIKILNSLPGK